jgi:hypothetical protein
MYDQKTQERVRGIWRSVAVTAFLIVFGIAFLIVLAS